MDNYNNNNNNNNDNYNYNYSYNYNNSADPEPEWQPDPGNTPEKKKKSRFGIGILVGVMITIAVFLIAAVVGVFFFARSFLSGNIQMSSEQKLSTIQTYLDKYFLWDIDEQKLSDGTAAGLLYGTGDKYAQYYNAEEFKNLMEDQSGSYSGIGVSIVENNDGSVAVAKVYPDSPAAEADIRVKDVIVEANGIRDFRDLDELISIVRGEEGTSVDLVVLRDGEEIPVTVVRRKLTMNSVSYKMLDNKIGYIKLDEFNGTTISQFNEALDALYKDGMTSLILDVRNNPGGDYDSVMAVADRVLPKGLITSVVDKDGAVKTESSDEEHKITLPMAVLINENSASAAELFSGAIKDYNIATLIGKTTYGKGIIQSIFRLPDGSGMKFTTEEYLTPKGNHINGIGVVPDVEVALPENVYDDGEFTDEEDTQLQTAISILTEGKTAVTSGTEG